MPTKQKCLNPECVENEVSRGLCQNCYAAARSMVSRNKTTWAALVAAGKCLNPKPRGKKETGRTRWLKSGVNIVSA